MYSPRAFSVDDEDLLIAFIERYSFSTLINVTSDGVQVSHLPLLIERDNGCVVLSGHLARVNPQADDMDGSDCTAIFHGPHSYISPAWYAKSAEVPTWNYAVVHAKGRARVTTDVDSLSGIVDKLVENNETKHGAPWNRHLEPAYRAKQLSHISGFRIVVDSLRGKFKLGQNRSRADQDLMLQNLDAATDNDARLLAKFIRRYRDQC